MLERNDPKFMELVEKGIPIERLERRLRPELGLDNWNAEKEKHDGFGDYSCEGFLGMDESLLDVVHADWETLERYGTTHQEVAEALAKAIKTEKVPNPEYVIKQGAFTMGVQNCPWECKGKYERGNSFITIYNVQKTSQQDLMAIAHNIILGNKFDEREMKEVFNDERLTSFLINSKKAVKDSGNLTDRVAVVTELHPHLIGEHYFFEGKQSPYRADPRVLIPALNLARHP